MQGQKGSSKEGANGGSRERTPGTPITPLSSGRSSYGSIPDATKNLPSPPIGDCEISLANLKPGSRVLTEHSALLPQTNEDSDVRTSHKGHGHTQSILGSVYGFAKSISPRSVQVAKKGTPYATVSEENLDWISIGVVYWVILVSEGARGLVLPSTWPYVETLNGTRSQLGVVVAALSIGRICTTIPLGWASDKVSTRTVLLVATIIQVLGHVWYAVAPSVTILIASRIVVGFGSATMSVCRAHIAKAVPPGMRTWHFAYVSALQFIGYAVLPGVGGLLNMLPEKKVMGRIPLNGFTYPAWALVLCNALAYLVIFWMYVDPPAGAGRSGSGGRKNGENRDKNDTENDESGGQKLNDGGSFAGSVSLLLSDEEDGLRPDGFAMFVCLLINVAFRGGVAEIETISTPFLMSIYHMSFSEVSYFLSLLGLIGLAIYMSFKPIARLFSDRNLAVFGLVALIVGCAPLSLSFISNNIPFGAYIFFLGLCWSIAYPVGQTAALSLFSKVLADLPAGGFLGIFSACGSLARVIFAMLAGKVWSEFGRSAVFVSIAAYAGITLIVTMATYRRLIPPSFL